LGGGEKESTREDAEGNLRREATLTTTSSYESSRENDKTVKAAERNRFCQKRKRTPKKEARKHKNAYQKKGSAPTSQQRGGRRIQEFSMKKGGGNHELKKKGDKNGKKNTI